MTELERELIDYHVAQAERQCPGIGAASRAAEARREAIFRDARRWRMVSVVVVFLLLPIVAVGAVAFLVWWLK